MIFNSEISYNESSPKKKLKHQKILKETLTSKKTLAELKGVTNTPPNQTMLVNTLPLQEPRTNSKIVNISTTHNNLYETFSTQTGNCNQQTKKVLHYRKALWEGYNKLKKNNLLITNLIIKIF